MQVEVKFFASLRDVLGVSGLHCELPTEARLPDLLVHLQAQLGEGVSELTSDAVKVAINQNLLAPSELAQCCLRQGDEVAFLPPVTGG